MKWIGQHIYDLTARFRSNVHLESVATGTIVSGGNLGLDSSNKIVKATITSGSGDLTSIVAGTGLIGTGLTGPIPTLNVDASQTQITELGTIDTGIWRGDNIAAGYVSTLNQDTTGSAATLTTPRAINGVDFNGSAAITITSAAGTLTGTALKDTIATSNLTSVGTIDNGAWQGTAVASEYLDADTAHLTTTQTFTGVKTFNEAINKKALHFLYTANKFTTDTSVETYFSLSDADRDTTSEDGVGVMAIVPLTGVLKHVLINCSSNLSGKTWEFRVYRVPSGEDADSGGEILVATVASNAGPAGHTNKKISFVSGTADTNVITYETGYTATTMFTAGDRILLSLQSNSDAAGNPKINSVLCFELDESTI